jgi:hypothetical protein
MDFGQGNFTKELFQIKTPTGKRIESVDVVETIFSKKILERKLLPASSFASVERSKYAHFFRQDF